jgi:hypothetical protein
VWSRALTMLFHRETWSSLRIRAINTLHVISAIEFLF